MCVSTLLNKHRLSFVQFGCTVSWFLSLSLQQQKLICQFHLSKKTLISVIYILSIFRISSIKRSYLLPNCILKIVDCIEITTYDCNSLIVSHYVVHSMYFTMFNISHFKSWYKLHINYIIYSIYYILYIRPNTVD